MTGEAPLRYCDIVMKGGITSGVVYPLAITELAEEFRFKNVGGTSAGAIAAALTAAAEYARLQGSGTAFQRLAALPQFLAGKTEGEPNLLNLFPPTRPTRRLFAVLAAFLGDGTLGEKVVGALSALLVVSPLITLISVLPSVLLPLLFGRSVIAGVFDAPIVAGLIVVELALLVLSGVLLILGNAVLALTRTLPRNRFGFSTGLTPDDRSLPGISDWLHAEIQATVGRTTDQPPLTFGDLWLAGVSFAPEERTDLLKDRERDADLRSINLQMISTALTHGHPYRLPFENRRFAFRPSEFRLYFPATIVDYLVSHSRPNDDVAAMNDPDLVALPEPWDLPVVIATRMSLSFPLLFSMVPLYAVDYTLRLNSTSATRFDRCWFIDGGLSSNFPVSLFDSPFPRWPTFGINLDGFHPDHPKQSDEDKNVWMPQTAGGGTSDHWTTFPDTGGAAIGGYIGAMLDTIRNWHDNTQMAVPGFRDRIVHVRLSPDEGGLNLNMDSAKVASLSERGRCAGQRLRARFGINSAAGNGPNWNTHRWSRYRTSMALLQKFLRQTDRAFNQIDPPFPSYPDLVGRSENDNPKTSYWWTKAVAEHQDQTRDLVSFADAFSNTTDLDDDNAPHPQPELRVTPKL